MKVYTSQEKWSRGRSIVDSWSKHYDTCEKSVLPVFNHKQLERDRGFMIHLGRTYPWIMPYLKGVHHTLETWRSQRDGDGWKYTDREWRELISELQTLESIQENTEFDKEEGAPETVEAVPRLRLDVSSLKTLMESGEPPKRLVRGGKLLVARYGFGDASGAGFGSS